ncbi:hypothetical protein DRQ11_10730 [candidate division KSB1 bacterium]|nr:MAG: hypothetical protein DRQ11_10730 [candidate division KSB1 bacterium]
MEFISFGIATLASLFVALALSRYYLGRQVLRAEKSKRDAALGLVARDMRRSLDDTTKAVEILVKVIKVDGSYLVSMSGVLNQKNGGPTQQSEDRPSSRRPNLRVRRDKLDECLPVLQGHEDEIRALMDQYKIKAAAEQDAARYYRWSARFFFVAIILYAVSMVVKTVLPV